MNTFYYLRLNIDWNWRQSSYHYRQILHSSELYEFMIHESVYFTGHGLPGPYLGLYSTWTE